MLKLLEKWLCKHEWKKLSDEPVLINIKYTSNEHTIQDGWISKIECERCKKVLYIHYE